MSQHPASSSISQTPAAMLASSNIEGIFETALKSYKKKTKQDLKQHDLFKQFEKCDSPGAILAAFQADQLVFAGVGVLLLAAKDVAASEEILVDIFGRIHSFFSRLDIYTRVPLTPAMTDKMVEITVEVLDILATATKEMKESRAKKFVKRVTGRTDLEDGLKKLDKLTNEESLLASAQLLKITHDIHNVVTAVADGVEGVDKKVQVIVDDGKQIMATAMEAKLIVRHAADNVEDVMRNQLRETLRRWQSAPDPSTNHNFARDRQHEGTAEWLIKDDKFGEWKVTGSLLWIHGKPGSGKSVLCSAIINDIITLCKDGSASMAYFYFDFRDINKQARHNLLSSLLTQLSDRSDHFCDILYRLYKEILTLPDQGPVYLLMDALDECPDTSDVPSPREQVLDLVKDLVGLRIPSLHICITSRPEVDISDVLESIASQTVFLQDESGQKKDIADYVRSVVYSGSGKFMRRWRLEDKEHVIETLSERADGMFRWVFCQLEMLRNCLPQNVRSVLTELPKSLDETYERMLKEIGKVNPHQAHRLLQCLTVATRPLRVEELAEVLALDFDGANDGIPTLNDDWRWDDEKQGILDFGSPCQPRSRHFPLPYPSRTSPHRHCSSLLSNPAPIGIR
ncbi:hypothetical protein EDB83DRAFT_1718302 [Lactarius deliciosus]|nr:hypothetical protein EDB83DRAFT_1718302 [Lactarius deliciosus]